MPVGVVLCRGSELCPATAAPGRDAVLAARHRKLPSPVTEIEAGRLHEVRAEDTHRERHVFALTGVRALMCNYWTIGRVKASLEADQCVGETHCLLDMLCMLLTNMEPTCETKFI